MTYRHAFACLAIAALLSAPALASRPPKESKNDKCLADATVIVNVGGTRFAVPRVPGTRVLLADGKTATALGRPNHQAGYDCATPSLEAKGFFFNGIFVGETNMKGTGSDKVIRANHQMIASAPRSHGSVETRMPNGLLKITAPELSMDIYLLPLDKAPTQDRVPVAFACDTTDIGTSMAKIVPQICKASYIHPSGVPVSFTVFQSDYPKYNFIDAEATRRKTLQDMLDKAKDAEDTDNKDKK